jgi:hypothetical protein
MPFKVASIIDRIAVVMFARFGSYSSDYPNVKHARGNLAEAPVARQHQLEP